MRSRGHCQLFAIFVLSLPASVASANEAAQSPKPNRIDAADDTSTALADLQLQLDDLRHRLDVATGKKRSPIGLELSLGIPLENNQLYWSIEVSYRWAYVQYHFCRGGGLGLRPTLNFGDLVEWQVLRVGLHFWHGQPVSFTDLDRIWDIVIGTKVSVRLWDRWRLSAAIAWYVPNPYDVGDWSMAERDRRAAKELNEQFDKIETVAEGWLKGDIEGWQDNWPELPTEGDITKDAYRSVGLRPQVLIGIGYDF